MRPTGQLLNKTVFSFAQYLVKDRSGEAKANSVAGGLRGAAGDFFPSSPSGSKQGRGFCSSLPRRCVVILSKSRDCAWAGVDVVGNCPFPSGQLRNAE